MIKNILLLFVTVSLSFYSYAQTSYSVSATPNLVFSPASLSINVGDTVVWTNVGGTHNVNGSTATFSGNPASFSSGAASSSSWTYSFVFTVAGAYNYQCDVHAGSGMTGTITVAAPSSININTSKNDLLAFPNPFTSELSIRIDKEVLNEGNILDFMLFDILGNLVRKNERISSGILQINTSDLSNGIYIYAFKVNGETLKTGKLTKS